MKKQLQKLSSILLCFVMLLGLLPTTALAAETTVITSANATITKPVGGEKPDSNPAPTGEGYTVRFVKWYLGEEPFTDVDVNEGTFEAGKSYALRVTFELKEGYSFADDCVFTINGEETACFGASIAMRQKIYTAADGGVAPPTTYTVTVNGGIASPAGPNTEGTEVTITATPPANMGFKQWNGLDGVTFVDDTNKQSATATFKMPAEAVEATAVYGINNVTATATGNITPVLGNNAETNPTFTYNFSELGTMPNSTWRYSSDGEEWEYAGYTEATKKFCAGYWYFDLNAKLNGLSISDPCTVTVNGTKWQIKRPSVNLAADSPVYYLDAEGNVSVVMFKIDGVTATCPAMPKSLSAEDTLPHLTFTPSPQQAVIRGDGTWQKKSGDNWVNANGAVEAGKTYRYETKMHIDASVATHTFANDVTLKVNGTSWTVDYGTMQENGTSSVSVMVYSPEITVTEATTYTVTFDANGGTGTMADATGVSGEYELPACTFTAPSDKQFKAWSVGGVEKAVGDKITVTADTTVTAVWESVSEYTKKGDISAVEATATIAPVLGAKTSAVSFTITKPTDAAAKGVIISGSSWYKKDASSIYGWTQCSNGVDTFEEGTYRLSVQLRSKSNDAKEYYAMSGDTTFTVNGVQWNGEESFRDCYATGGYGYRFFVSPEFTLGGKTLDSIAVTTPPTKTAYREGEDFNPAGMVVTATYTDSTTAPVVLYTVTDGTAMAAGKTSVTISYTEGGVTKTTKQDITVAKEYKVTVIGGTGNGKYVAGEEVRISAFVSTGKQFKEWTGADGLTFTSGSKTSATATFTMPAHDVTVTAVTGPAEYYVSVSGGSGTGMYETGETVTIVADAPEAGKQFKTWVVGDGKVLRFTEGDITSSTAKFVMPGEAVRISATYEDISAPKTLYSIAITTPPTKTAYTAGETFEPTGMVVTATYSDSSTTPVTGYTVSPSGALSESDTQITVTYTEGGVTKTATQTITVTAASGSGGTGSSGSGGGYTYYTIKATAGVNGAISPSGSVSVREGRDQTFTITPDKGYAVSNVKIDGKSIGAVKSYTFENVRRTHTIEVIFMKANGNPQTGVFVDVATGSYYEDAVDWAVENGITKGTDDTHFSPDGICTRAQAVTFLWRAAGSPKPETRTMPFADVPAGSYYYDAVLWAVENGITKGTSDTTFSPDATCSRAQIVTFLWRSEKSPAAGTANPFADVKSTVYYADAVLWAVKENITKGTTSTTFSPDVDCTRAQIVTFLWRCKK